MPIFVRIYAVKKYTFGKDFFFKRRCYQVATISTYVCILQPNLNFLKMCVLKNPLRSGRIEMKEKTLKQVVSFLYVQNVTLQFMSLNRCLLFSSVCDLSVYYCSSSCVYRKYTYFSVRTSLSQFSFFLHFILRYSIEL